MDPSDTDPETVNLQKAISSHASPAQPPQSVPPAAAPTPPPPRDSYATDPEPFSGQMDKCRGFLLQCAMVFQQRPQAFTSDQSKEKPTFYIWRGSIGESSTCNNSILSICVSDNNSFVDLPWNLRSDQRPFSRKYDKDNHRNDRIERH
ncbi:uncharacterized protein LOC117263758 [Epinephelus lanceolatus]